MVHLRIFLHRIMMFNVMSKINFKHTRYVSNELILTYYVILLSSNRIRPKQKLTYGKNRKTKGVFFFLIDLCSVKKDHINNTTKVKILFLFTSDNWMKKKMLKALIDSISQKNSRNPRYTIWSLSLYSTLMQIIHVFSVLNYYIFKYYSCTSYNDFTKLRVHSCILISFRVRKSIKSFVVKDDITTLYFTWNCYI